MTPAGVTTPARSSPDMSASPIGPAPSTAIPRASLPGRAANEPCGDALRSAARRERAEEEGQVRRPFREPPDQVPVPVAAVRNVDPHAGAAGGQAELLGGPDPVEHLVLEAVGGPARRAGPHPGDADQPPGVRGDHRGTPAVPQYPPPPPRAPLPPRP